MDRAHGAGYIGDTKWKLKSTRLRRNSHLNLGIKSMSTHKPPPSVPAQHQLAIDLEGTAALPVCFWTLSLQFHEITSPWAIPDDGRTVGAWRRPVNLLPHPALRRAAAFPLRPWGGHRKEVPGGGREIRGLVLWTCCCKAEARTKTTTAIIYSL